VKKRTTIKDVAEYTGVSTATVSYVLNGKVSENISESTINRVMAACKQLNYIPNLSARSLSLSSKRSNLVGIVIPQTEDGEEFMFDNPYYGEFLSRAEYIARKKGYDVLISGRDANRSYLNIATQRGLDGIVIIGIYPDDNISELKYLGLPIVMCDSYGIGSYFNCVGTNDRYAGYMATKYLLDKGHKRVALVSGQEKVDGVNYYRFIGYKDALEEHNIEFDERIVYEGYIDHKYGIEAGKKIIDANLGVTAVFATADILAVGVMKGMQEEGIKIPEEISIIGFDDIYLASICTPSLTTVRQHIGEKGSTVMELLLDAIEDEPTSKRDIIIPVDIVERNSVKEIK